MFKIYAEGKKGQKKGIMGLLYPYCFFKIALTIVCNLGILVNVAAGVLNTLKKVVDITVREWYIIKVAFGHVSKMFFEN